MKKILLLTCCWLVAFGINAQQRTVTGKVTDGTDGSPLPGVSILVKGTANGTVTDSNGSFSVDASPSDVLTFSFIGFEPQDIAVGERSTFDVSMVASASQLQEVVVIGYGERERKDVTGAISSMSAKDISKNTSMTPELAMQGRMAGVYVSTPSGSPFDRPTVRIRGVSTFGWAEPLYVIDGVPIIEGGASSGNAGFQDIRSPINIMTAINPNDIESISVLKDASAAAIYGVRASNGVVLITTKKGKAGKAKVEFSAQRGVQNSPKTKELLNSADYAQLYREAYANNPAEAGNLPNVYKEADPGYLGNGPSYDWQKEFLNKNASIEDYSVRVSGGSENSTYYISGGYGRTEGSLKGNDLERYSLATNVTSKIAKYIETGLNLKMSYNQALNNSQADLGYASTAPAWQPIYDSNDPTGYAPSVTGVFTVNPDYNPALLNSGPPMNLSTTYLWGPSTQGNFFANQQFSNSGFELFRTIGNAYVQVEPLKGLKVKGTISADYYFNLRKEWNEYLQTWRFSQTPGNPYQGQDGTGRGSYGERQNRNMNLVKEFSINYNKTFGNHNIDFLVNAMDQRQVWRFTDGSTSMVTSTDPDLRNVSNMRPYTSGFTGTVPQALIGYLGRVSYKFKDKYYLDATVRRDGSSVFAKGYKWGTFPSFAAGWRISSEDFFQNLSVSQINDLKIRGGWGELGNKETTQGFAYIPTINTAPDYALGSGVGGDYFGVQYQGIRIPNYPNFELSWERVQTTNIGFDAVLFNSHVTFTAEYYNRLTKGIIQNVPLAPNGGIEVGTDLNIATVKNNGIELQLGYNGAVGDLTFNVSGNFTTNKNRVKALFRDSPIGAAGGRVEIGQPIGYIYGYKVGGIFQSQDEIDAWKSVYEDEGRNDKAPGDMYFQDLSGAPAIGEYFNPVPDSVVNDNDQTYLGKTIPGFFYGFNIGATWKGFDISLFFQGIGDVQKYNWARALGEGMNSDGDNQWATTKGRWTPENHSTTMPRASFKDPLGNTRMSDRFVEDAGFLRLKNVQIGYSIPASVLGKTNVVERVRIYVSGTNVFTATKWTGIDPENDYVPPLRQFMIGLNAAF